MSKNTKKLWISLSVICFMIGVAVWLPNILLGKAYSYYLLTFVINPVGILFGYLGRSKTAMISNLVMTNSFFILMFFGYLIAAIFGGQP
ncbi:hypothetical protein [Alkalihalobacterium sp. APHAB7]|uniref:hypothetical protein n=1 Tax=Alkalihalobacterium sp. APHAB7 TaxID=3402081 RepID=UPI003AAF3E35